MESPADRLRITFEVSSLRQAVELAAELRSLRRGTVRIRPAPLRRLAGRRWDVTLTSEPVPGATGMRRAPVRVLVVDDSRPFRYAARELLTRRGYVVVGEAETAAKAIDATERLAPDAILLDVHLPDACSFELTASLIEMRPGVAVLLTSADDAPPVEERVEASGARGFVLKRCLATAPLERFWPAP